MLVEGDKEITLLVREATVEIMVPNHAYVLAAHVPQKLAVRMALWLLWHWINASWCGLRPWLRSRAMRQQVLGSSAPD